MEKADLMFHMADGAQEECPQAKFFLRARSF
jgi:hypothetical protein